MKESKFNTLMHIMFMITFALILVVFHKQINKNNTMVDKIAEISNKVNVPCEVQTNHVLWITGHKIVK